MLETSGLRDAMATALDMSRALPSDAGLKGYGVAELRDESTNLVKLYMPFANLITTVGDEYYAKQAGRGQSTNGGGGTLCTGMRLGTSNTAAAKSSTGSAIVADVGTGSYAAWNTGYPLQAAVAGTDTGWYISYQCVWAAGTVTNSALYEVVILNSNTLYASANTYSRAVFGSSINKTANDSLTVTWNHKFLGA